MKGWLPALVALVLAVASAALSQVLSSHSPALLGRPEPRSDWLDEWVPRELGDWTAESRAISTDVLVTAGAGHYLARKYTNQTTGQAVDLLLIYGDPVRMHQHTPELCYPAAGYDRAGFPRTGLVRVGSSVAGFAVTGFMGRDSTAPNRVAVWCGWRDDTGHWIPTLKRRQVAKLEDMWRLMASSHALPVEAGGRQPGTCEAFLQVALPELEPIVAGVPPCHSPD
ncbi:MAG: exosortase-associated EpsI family protein [Planctomycetes bacterium]|nr:exosortase-associated EpsI family protein [Planctomycetota bacterium]